MQSLLMLPKHAQADSLVAFIAPIMKLLGDMIYTGNCTGQFYESTVSH